MKTIKKVSIPELKNNLINIFKPKVNTDTLAYKLQNFEKEQQMENMELFIENQAEYAKRMKNNENMKKIKEILINIINNNIATLDVLQNLNKSISEVDNLKVEDLELLYEIFKNHPASVDSPKNVLERNNISLEEFNSFLKDAVKNDYSTLKGVIIAGLALSEFSLLTGENFRYSSSLANRNQLEGIEENTYLDCSSFVFWTLFNGGYNWPTIDKNKEDEYYNIILEENNIGREVSYNDGIINNNLELNAWAKVNNLMHDPKNYNVKQGDFLLVNKPDISGRHIMMILEEDNDYYYVLEERGEENGLILNKRSKEEIIEKGYQAIDMQPYYNDENNKRK